MTTSKVNALFGLSVIRAVTRNAEPLCEAPGDVPQAELEQPLSLGPEPFISEIGRLHGSKNEELVIHDSRRTLRHV